MTWDSLIIPLCLSFPRPLRQQSCPLCLQNASCPSDLHFHCHHPGPGHHHFSPGFLPGPCSYSASHSAEWTELLEEYIDHITLLLKTAQWLPWHTQCKPDSSAWPLEASVQPLLAPQPPLPGSAAVTLPFFLSLKWARSSPQMPSCSVPCPSNLSSNVPSEKCPWSPYMQSSPPLLRTVISLLFSP